MGFLSVEMNQALLMNGSSKGSLWRHTLLVGPVKRRRIRYSDLLWVVHPRPQMICSAREKSMIVNLEFIREIVTAEEELLLDPLRQEVLPFVDQMRRQLPQKSSPKYDQMVSQDNKTHSPTAGQWLHVPEPAESVQDEDDLPFEFQVLDMALEAVCTYLDLNIGEIERDDYPALMSCP